MGCGYSPMASEPFEGFASVNEQSGGGRPFDWRSPIGDLQSTPLEDTSDYGEC